MTNTQEMIQKDLEEKAELWDLFYQMLNEGHISVIFENAIDSIDGGEVVSDVGDVLDRIREFKKQNAEKELGEAATSLYLKLLETYPMTFPPKFLVASGVNEIIVYAPKRYKEIPETYMNFLVSYHQSDCNFIAQ